MPETFSIIQTLFFTVSVLLFVSLLSGSFLPFWSSNVILLSNSSSRLNEGLHIVFNKSHHSNQSYIHVGIWQTCYEYLGYYCIGDHGFKNTFNYESGWMTTIRILLLIALLSAVAPIVTVAFKKFGNVCCAFIYVGTSILIMISISSYAAKNTGQTLGFSYIVTVIAGIGYMLLGIMYCLRWSYDTPSACAFIWNHDKNQETVVVSKWKGVCLLSITITLFIIQQVNFIMPFWKKTYLKHNDTVFEGVFLKCFFEESIKCCGLLNQDNVHPSLVLPSGFLYVKISAATSFLVDLVRLILTFGWLFKKKSKKMAFWNSFISFCDSFIIIIVIVISVAVSRTEHGDRQRFHASFFIAVSLAVLHFACAVISCIVRKNMKQKETSTHLSRSSDYQTAHHNAAYDQGYDDDEQVSVVSDVSSEDYDTSEISCPLSRGSKKYIDVESRFYESIEPKKYEIIQIEHIQNNKLKKQYKVEKDAIKSTGAKEMYLWHGTTAMAVDNINNKGFSRSYHGINGTLYGKGTYFAVEASYSAQDRYSEPDNDGHKKMYCCRVLTGKYTKGKEEMKDPPNGYHSVVDDVTNPTMFVIFRDAQAYPEHLITFKANR